MCTFHSNIYDYSAYKEVLTFYSRQIQCELFIIIICALSVNQGNNLHANKCCITVAMLTFQIGIVPVRQNSQSQRCKLKVKTYRVLVTQDGAGMVNLPCFHVICVHSKSENSDITTKKEWYFDTHVSNQSVWCCN